MIVTIDPGAYGAMYVESTNTFVDFKTQGLEGYVKALKEAKPDLAILEKVHSFSRQGVKSMFSFGQRFGELIGILTALDIPYQTVEPRNWQKVIGVEPKSGKEGIFSIVRKHTSEEHFLGPKGGIIDGRCDAYGMYLSHKTPKEENVRNTKTSPPKRGRLFS